MILASMCLSIQVLELRDGICYFGVAQDRDVFNIIPWQQLPPNAFSPSRDKYNEIAGFVDACVTGYANLGMDVQVNARIARLTELLNVVELPDVGPVLTPRD